MFYHIIVFKTNKYTNTTLLKLVPPKGIAPSTPWASTMCSTTELQGQMQMVRTGLTFLLQGECLRIKRHLRIWMGGMGLNHQLRNQTDVLLLNYLSIWMQERESNPSGLVLQTNAYPLSHLAIIFNVRDTTSY